MEVEKGQDRRMQVNGFPFRVPVPNQRCGANNGLVQGRLSHNHSKKKTQQAKTEIKWIVSTTIKCRYLSTDVFTSQRAETKKSNSAVLTNPGLTGEPPEQCRIQFSSLRHK